MIDYIVIAVIAVIVIAAAGYVHKAKKSGQKCIGCPDSCSCGSSGGCGHCGGCGTEHH